MSLLSVSEYAKQQGLSRQAVYKQVNKGLLEIEKKDNKVYIKIDKVEQDVNQNDNQKIALEKEENYLKEVESLKESLHELQIVNTGLQSNLKSKEEIINLKDENLKVIESKNQEIINSKNETIESQKETIRSLQVSYTHLEEKYQNQAKLLTQSKEQTPKEEKVIIESVNLETQANSQEQENPKDKKSEKDPITQKTKSENSTISPKTENLKIELMEFLQEQGITDSKVRKKIRARFDRRLNKDSRILKDKNGKIQLDKNQDYSKIINP